MRSTSFRSSAFLVLGCLAFFVMGCLLCFVLGCTDGRRYDQAVCILIDISGTYADQKEEVVRVIKRQVLPTMVPGDTLITILVDSESYEKENVRALMTLDPRPSRANAQKLALARQLDEFAAGDERSRYTDIPGAMMLGAEYLQEIASGSRIMLIFSDLQEELPAGSRRQMRETELANIRVVAMNVKRLEGDTNDPEIFRRRLQTWGQRIERSGGVSWRTFMDSSKLPGYLAEVRS
jgi:hypothetical protein